MFKLFVSIAFVATFVCAQDDPMSSLAGRKKDETNIDEYIKEYTKLSELVYPGASTFVSSNQVGKVQPEHVKIRLYSSPEEIIEGTLKDYTNVLRYPKFNETLETKIVIRGWLDKDYTKVFSVLAQLYALRGKRVNLISVDWSEYAFSRDFYYTSQEIVPKVAEYMVSMVQHLMNVQGNNKVHIIGFDMGAHIAGITGKRVQPKMARITGLSPAGRFFNDVSEDRRLAKGDAEFVDVIHTSMGGAGIAKTIGDIDFLPNGGRQQPFVEQKGDRIEKEVVSHMLAFNYYFESVELGYAGFIGKKCESWNSFLNQRCAFNEVEIMGEPVSTKVYGTVYLAVNKGMLPYYSKGIYGLYNYGKAE